MRITLLFVLCIVNFSNAMESYESLAFKRPKPKKETMKERARQRMPLSLKIQAGIRVNQLKKQDEVESLLEQNKIPQEILTLLSMLPYEIEMQKGLYKALKHNNSALVQEWLAYRDKPINVNDIVIGRNFDRPLHIAALSGDKELLKIFTDLNDDFCVCTTNFKGHTPLHYAVLNGNAQAVKHFCLLISASRSHNNSVTKWLTGWSWAPYELAHALEYTDIKNILLKNEFQQTSTTIEKDKLFFMALEAGATHAVNKMILENKGVMNYEFSGQPALHRASQFGHTDIVKLLFENGAQVNALEKNSDFSALHWAATGGHIEMIHLLLENGANINQQTKDGSTPLHSAAEFGKMYAFQALCDRGAKTDIKNNKNLTPQDIVKNTGSLSRFLYE